MQEKLKVVSFTKLGVPSGDYDAGVLRVPLRVMSKCGFGRNDLARITVVDHESDNPLSLVRVVRASTGKGCLQADELALQYDDRVLLGIKRAGETFEIRLEKLRYFEGIFPFLWFHTSPSVSFQTRFKLSLFVLGGIIGYLAGLLSA